MTSDATAPFPGAAYGIGRLFDLVPDAIVLGDAVTGRILLWNRAAEEVFGYPRSDAIGMPIDAIVPTNYLEAHRTGLRRYVDGGSAGIIGTQRLVELPALTADGRQIWVELRLAPVDQGPGDHVVLAIIRDVTARRLAEDEAASARRDLQTSNESLLEFMSVAAHDLRGPLSAVLGAVHLLGKRADRMTAEQRAETHVIASRQIAFMTRLIEDLLEITNIDAQTVRTIPAAVDLDETIRESLVAAELVDGVSVDVPEGVTVWADPTHTTRILTNLLANAKKYGRPPVDIAASLNDDAVLIRITDNGPGIAAPLEPRLFDKFSRGDDHATPGSGLGLAIVRGLTRANGGDTWYEHDGRPTFTVRLPRSVS